MTCVATYTSGSLSTGVSDFAANSASTMSWMRRSASASGEDVPAVQLYVLYSLNCSCGFESVVTFWAKPPAVMASAIVKVHSVRIIMGSSGAHHVCKMGSKTFEHDVVHDSVT